MNNNVKEIIKVLDNRKADDIKVVTDSDKHYIFATALNGRHISAIGYYLKENFSVDMIDISDDWEIVVIENVEVHVMTLEYRQKYNIEMLIKERIEQAQVIDGISGKDREAFKLFLVDKSIIKQINFKKIDEIIFLNEEAIICILEDKEYLSEMKTILSLLKEMTVSDITSMENSFKFSNQPTIFLMTSKDKDELKIKY